MMAASRSPVRRELGRQVVEVDVAVRGGADHGTDSPASTADAALVPCADCGIRQTVRWASPRERW